MPASNEFDTELRKAIAGSIPCMHMPTLILAEKALTTFKKYLNQSKERGLVTIDDILEDMNIKDGQPRD